MTRCRPFAPFGGDVALLMLLAMIALSGLVLLAVRATGAMGLAMAVHLGFILAFFVVLPYSKMVHGVTDRRRCCAGRSSERCNRWAGSRLGRGLASSLACRGSLPVTTGPRGKRFEMLDQGLGVEADLCDTLRYWRRIATCAILDTIRCSRIT